MSDKVKSLSLEHGKRGYVVTVFRKEAKESHKRYVPTQATLGRLQNVFSACSWDGNGELKERNTDIYFHPNGMKVIWYPLKGEFQIAFDNADLLKGTKGQCERALADLPVKVAWEANWVTQQANLSS